MSTQSWRRRRANKHFDRAAKRFVRRHSRPLRMFMLLCFFAACGRRGVRVG